MTKLNPEQVVAIRRRFWDGESPADLAHYYGVHRSTVYRAANIQTYSTVGWEPVRDAMQVALAYIRQHGLDPDDYGVCTVSDPRQFIPDPEMATPGELYRWCDAVMAAQAGKGVDEWHGGWSKDGSVHITRTPWGYGLNHRGPFHLIVGLR